MVEHLHTRHTADLAEYGFGVFPDVRYCQHGELQQGLFGVRRALVFSKFFIGVNEGPQGLRVQRAFVGAEFFPHRLFLLLPESFRWLQQHHGAVGISHEMCFYQPLEITLWCGGADFFQYGGKFKVYQGMGAVEPAFHDHEVVVEALGVTREFRLAQLELDVIDACLNEDRINAL